MQEIKTILFDFGNVIIDIDVPGTKARIESFLRPGTDLTQGMRRMTSLVHGYETGVLDTDAFINAIIDDVRNEVTARDIIEAWNAMLIGIPKPRLEMLEELKSRYKVLMLSNTNALHVKWITKHLHEVHDVRQFEQQFFHRVYYSHEIKLRKPHREAFQFVVDDASISPATTLFIDDMLENIEAAVHCGFQTRLLEEHEEITDVLRRMGLY